MKLSRLILTVILIFIFAACAKDEMLDQSNNQPELKKANLAIPLKGDFSAVPDLESSLWLIPIPGLDPEDPASYEYTRMIVSGTCTHLGKIDPEKSFYVFDAFELIFEGEEPILMQSGYSHLVGANGDCIDLTWWVKALLSIPGYTGEIEITGGTGRFEGCSGTATMKGNTDAVSMKNCWTIDGTLEFN